MGWDPGACSGASGEAGAAPRLLDGLDEQHLAEAECGDGMRRLLAFVFTNHSPDGVWLREGFVKWFQDGHALSLERCLRLPTTAAKRQQAIRNYWLLEASNYIDAPNARRAGVLLEKELNSFLTRGNWLRWRDDSDPPGGLAPEKRTP